MADAPLWITEADVTSCISLPEAIDALERILAMERAQEVRAALPQLPSGWRQMIELLMADPPASYAEISSELGLPVGSIGPTRSRCLDRLRGLLEAS